MKKSLASLADNFNTIRTGRANPAVLDKIMVRVTGGQVSQAGGVPVHIVQRKNHQQA